MNQLWHPGGSEGFGVTGASCEVDTPQTSPLRLALCRKAGFLPELAWTCCDYADCLLQRNDAGDRGGGHDPLDESLAISNKLGMGPLLERVLSRRKTMEA